jgi:hypothetical protein
LNDPAQNVRVTSPFRERRPPIPSHDLQVLALLAESRRISLAAVSKIAVNSQLFAPSDGQQGRQRNSSPIGVGTSSRFTADILRSLSATHNNVSVLKEGVGGGNRDAAEASIWRISDDSIKVAFAEAL